ncbi:hypothetical protein Tco_1270271, partial [Tanacetum coccineum]
MEEDSKVPLILGQPFLHTADAVIRVKQKQLNLRVGTERMIFYIDYAMKHSYSNDDTCFSIDVIDEILKEDFDALLDEGSKILHSIEGTLLEEEIFAEFDEFIAMTTDENSESESDTEDLPFKKITINTDYKIKTSLVDNSLTAELATYKEQVELYERRARFELTEREQKIDEQLRIVITDRNIKEANLKKELHSIKLQLASTINHNKSMVEEVT